MAESSTGQSDVQIPSFGATRPTLQSEELSYSESRDAEVAVSGSAETVPMAPEADKALQSGYQHEPESREAPEEEAGVATDLPGTQEENPLHSPTTDVREHIVSRGTAIDIRAGDVSGQIIGQLFEAVQRHVSIR